MIQRQIMHLLKTLGGNEKTANEVAVFNALRLRMFTSSA
jgi:hypothetical protein